MAATHVLCVVHASMEVPHLQVHGWFWKLVLGLFLYLVLMHGYICVDVCMCVHAWVPIMPITHVWGICVCVHICTCGIAHVCHEDVCTCVFLGI